MAGIDRAMVATDAAPEHTGFGRVEVEHIGIELLDDAVELGARPHIAEQARLAHDAVPRQHLDAAITEPIGERRRFRHGYADVTCRRQASREDTEVLLSPSTSPSVMANRARMSTSRRS